MRKREREIKKERGREREKKRERGRKRERERERKREREKERENIVALFLFLKGMTGALAPFSYLVLSYLLLLRPRSRDKHCYATFAVSVADDKTAKVSTM